MQRSHPFTPTASRVVQTRPVSTHRWTAVHSYRLHWSAPSRPAKGRLDPPVCQFRPDHSSSRDWEKPEQVVTILTTDGIVRLPMSSPSQDLAALRRRASRPLRAPLPSWEEQGLCLGATFMVAATNGHDPSRRINMRGFCRSVEMLSEVVEDSVLRRGGEVVRRTCAVRSSLHESLQLTVAIPFLFGVPPAHEMLSEAIMLGGGIVDRVQRQWYMY